MIEPGSETRSEPAAVLNAIVLDAEALSAESFSVERFTIACRSNSQRYISLQNSTDRPCYLKGDWATVDLTICR